MKLSSTLLSASIALLSTCTMAFATPKVIASIKPIHSLVAGVMGNVGTPALIVDGAASPHTHNLRPSQARDLQDAELIFWMGPQLETFLEKPLETLGQDAHVVTLSDTQDITRLEQREGGAFAAEVDHDDNSHDHDAHDHDDETDPHIWLDPQNALLLVKQIENALRTTDPANAEEYGKNADILNDRLQDLISETTSKLKPVKKRPFVVFHDAYHYFENRFGLAAAGTITVNPEIMPGAARVAEIQKKIRELDVTCVFSEPQFQPKIITVVAESSNAKSGILDPLGAEIDNGPDLYFELIRTMSDSIYTCLSPAE